MNKKIVYYPRGFSGYDIGLPVQDKSNSVSQILNAVRLNRSLHDKGNAVISNREIEKLYRQYKNGDRFIKSMAFREQILNAALKAFGTNDFLDWCVLQSNNPYLTDMHKRFLNDTFTFIQKGTRSLEILNWMSLITLRDIQPEDSRSTYRLDEYFGLNKPIEFRPPIDLKNNLCSWVSRKNGFDDLLGTLHIFFGDKDIH